MAETGDELVAILRAVRAAGKPDQPMPPHRISWTETRARRRKDRARLLAMLAELGRGRPLFVMLYPPSLCVSLYRLSHYFSARGWGKIGRLFWHLNLQLTGADIHPHSDLGGGLLIPNPAAVSILAKAGENLTLMALAGAGGLMPDRKDIGAGPGYPVLGDDVHLSPHAGVLGPVKIGDRVRIAPGCIVSSDLPDDATVSAPPTKNTAARTSR